jgi:translation initiation factor IF-2
MSDRNERPPAAISRGAHADPGTEGAAAGRPRPAGRGRAAAASAVRAARRYTLIHPDAALSDAEQQVLIDALEAMGGGRGGGGRSGPGDGGDGGGDGGGPGG